MTTLLPLMIPRNGMMGAQFICNYLCCIETENIFLNRFDSEDVSSLLESIKEYYIDIPTLVEVVNIDQWGAYHWNLKQSDIKTFHVNYVRIGPQWISCGGTSTGPILGILLCLAVVVIAQVYRKKRTGRLA